MDSFSLTELASFITIVVGAVGGLLVVAFKSKCDQVNCCWGGIKCHRVVELEIERSGNTFRRKAPPKRKPPRIAPIGRPLAPHSLGFMGGGVFKAPGKIRP